jgi:hypothetical protein
LFDAQRYRTGDEKILVLGLAEDEESPSGELPPLRRLPYEGPGGTAARTGHSMMIGPGGLRARGGGQPRDLTAIPGQHRRHHYLA